MLELLRRKRCPPVIPLLLVGLGVCWLKKRRQRWACHMRKMRENHEEQLRLLREIRDELRAKGKSDNPS